MESESSHVSVQGVDGEGESERERKKGGAVQRAGASDDPQALCGVCGEPMGSGDPEGRPWKGSYHTPCLARERRRVLNEYTRGPETYSRRRRGRGAG